MPDDEACPFTGTASVDYLDIGNDCSFLIALRPAIAGSVQTPAQVEFISTSTTAQRDGGALELFMPSDLVTDDVIVLFVASETPATGITRWPPGFTELFSADDTQPNAQRYAAAWKRSSGTEGLERVSVTGAVGATMATALAYRGVDLSSPVDLSGLTQTSAAVGTSWVVTPPLVGAASAGSVHLVISAVTSSAPDMMRASPNFDQRERLDQHVAGFEVSMSDVVSTGAVPLIPNATIHGTVSQETSVFSAVLTLNRSSTRPDAGAGDAGVFVDPDAGSSSDGGTVPTRELTVGCGCGQADLGALGAAFALLFCRSSRRRAR